jgi:hypothetical protein
MWPKVEELSSVCPRNCASNVESYTYILLCLGELIENILVSLATVSRFVAVFSIFPEALTHELRPEIEWVAKRLMHRLHGIATSHEDLEGRPMSVEAIHRCRALRRVLTRSKAVEQARGWVAAKIGRGAMLVDLKFVGVIDVVDVDGDVCKLLWWDE